MWRSISSSAIEIFNSLPLRYARGTMLFCSSRVEHPALPRNPNIVGRLPPFRSLQSQFSLHDHRLTLSLRNAQKRIAPSAVGAIVVLWLYERISAQEAYAANASKTNELMAISLQLLVAKHAKQMHGAYRRWSLKRSVYSWAPKGACKTIPRTLRGGAPSRRTWSVERAIFSGKRIARLK